MIDEKAASVVGYEVVVKNKGGEVRFLGSSTCMVDDETT